ncbi:MAG: hypothetical protein NTW80_10710, partial [Deltaproteobacteria bacterium]|nr:hypothetical protein [Deltaproteobacteria bacterium]
GKSFFSATAAVPSRNILEIKRLAGKTPPAPSGTKAAQFPQFSKAVKRPGRSIVPPLPKSGVKNVIFT